jgi:hypothetical protein
VKIIAGKQNIFFHWIRAVSGQEVEPGIARMIVAMSAGEKENLVADRLGGALRAVFLEKLVNVADEGHDRNHKRAGEAHEEDSLKQIDEKAHHNRLPFPSSAAAHQEGVRIL